MFVKFYDRFEHRKYSVIAPPLSLEYLKLIICDDAPVENEYVAAGSIYDNVGHFMLSAVTILSENRSISKFLVKAEGELFKRRLDLLSAYDIRIFAKKLLKSTKKCERMPPHFIDALQVFCRHLMIKDLAQHITSVSHGECCSEHKIGVHFIYCLSLIGFDRPRNGIATLSCGKFKQYLTILFNANITHRIDYSRLEPLQCDTRIMELVAIVKNDSLFKNTSKKQVKRN